MGNTIMQTTIESPTNPIFIDPITGFRMKIMHKRLMWDEEAVIYQPKWTYIPEHIIHQGTVNEQTIAAHHKQISVTTKGTIIVQYRVEYYEDGSVDLEGNPVAGYGNYVQSSAINQGRIVEFKVTNAVWVQSADGVIVPFNEIALEDAQGNLIQEPHTGLIGEYDRFISLKNAGVSLDALIEGSCLQALANGRFA